MTRKLMIALILIVLCVLVLIFTKGSVTLELYSLKRDLSTNIALLSFTVIGGVIGSLLK